MKELKLETRVEVYAVGELDNIYRQLYEAAFEASKKAYAPYSKLDVYKRQSLAHSCDFFSTFSKRRSPFASSVI